MGKEIFKTLYNFKIDTKFWDTINLTQFERDNCRNRPAFYLKKAIEIANILKLKTVVEIGATRHAVSNECVDFWNKPHEFISPSCCRDGHSSIFWSLEGFDIHTVDIDVNCIKQLNLSFENINKPTPSNLHIHIPRDGIDFLKRFDKRIEILFLDGWDLGTPYYREKHLEAFIAAQDKLADTHLVLIDDTDFKTKDGGKDALLSPRLLDMGYHLLFNGRQTLFINKL